MCKHPCGWIFAAAMGLAVVLPSPATAQWHDAGRDSHERNYVQPSQRHGGNSHGRHDGGYRGHDNSGAIVGGALLGLGVGALLGGALLAPSPPVYPRPPSYYYYNGAPPAYAYPNAAPPPVYNGR